MEKFMENCLSQGFFLQNIFVHCCCFYSSSVIIKENMINSYFKKVSSSTKRKYDQELDANEEIST